MLPIKICIIFKLYISLILPEPSIIDKYGRHNKLSTDSITCIVQGMCQKKFFAVSLSLKNKSPNGSIIIKYNTPILRYLVKEILINI